MRMMAILLGFVVLACASYGNTIQVPADYPTIQEGIDTAQDGDTVLVADGTYTKSGNRKIDFYGKAITVMSENGPEWTIIDCELGGVGFYFNSGEDSLSRLDGFTIRNGQDFDGGGIHCSNASSPAITNCTFTGNAATDGGAIHCSYSSPAITNCTITGNTGTNGGGIYCWSSSPSITNCTISENIASAGGGVYCFTYSSSPSITNCTITWNTASSSGGGIYSFGNPFTPLINSEISNNTAKVGGGIFCFGASVTITNCTIKGNAVSGSSYGSEGGGIYSMYTFQTITNCTITGNSADDGGGIYCEDNSSLVITNSILWDDHPEEIAVIFGDPIITYSDIQDGWEGESNIDSDPLFLDPETGDYNLQGDSPCIDAGDSYSRLDLNESRNDMGAAGGMGELLPGVIGGVISGTLAVSETPYIVTEDLVIEPDDTLSIEPGVELLFHNHSKMVIYGEIDAVGTEDSMIVLTRFQEWDTGGGIHFMGGNGTFQYCKIENMHNIYGGAIYCANASPLIDYCIISGNLADLYGGGIYCYDYSSPSIKNCTITGNTAVVGGGINCYEYCSPSITNCTISENSSSVGGGISCEWSSSPSISNCSISGNTSDYSGGGIYCFFSSFPTIMSCTITGNTASGDDVTAGGGGLYYDAISSVFIANCTISGNTSDYNGGGIYS